MAETIINTPAELLAIPSSYGVDHNDGPDKTWRCLACGALHRMELDEVTGISTSVILEGQDNG